MALTNEPFDLTLARRKRAGEAFPELQYSTPTQVADVDAAYPDALPSSFTRQMVTLADVASTPDYDPLAPDAAPNVTPWSSPDWTPPAVDERDPYGIRAPYQGPPGGYYGAASSPGETLRNVAGVFNPFSENSVFGSAYGGDNPVLQELARPSNYVGAGSGVRGLARGALSGIGGRFLGETAMDALPEDANPLLRGAVGLGAGLVGGVAGYRAIDDVPRLARQGKTWAEIADQALADASGATEAAIRQQVPDATQIGRVPGTDELFTAGPNGEFVGPTGNLSELRLGREPGMGENVNARRYFTNYGRAQQANLAADEQAAFRAASERAIAGADEAVGIGGGADLTPDEFARLAAKKAAGEALTPEEQDSVLQALGKAMGATTRDEQTIAREALYNGPVPTDMREVDTGLIEGVRGRLGAPTGRTVDDALRAAREAEGGIAGGADIPPIGDIPMSAADEPFPPTRSERALLRSLGDTRPVSPRLEGADAVTQLRQRIEDAKPLQEVQDAARGALRSRQAGAFTGALESGGGEAGMRRAIGAMRGQMDRPTFEPLRQYLDQSMVDDLTDQIARSNARPFEKVNAYEAMTNILDGRVPTPSSLAQLESVFPGITASLVKANVMSPPRASVIENVADVLNLWRTVKTAWDVSAPFRQGMMLAAGHPREFFGAMPDMFKAFAKSGVAEGVDDVLRNSDNAGLWEDAGLYLAPLDGKIGQREEAFMSKLAGKVPGVARSERAYVTYLNQLRANVFDSMWEKLPETAQTQQSAERIAKWVNSATGRGSIPEALEAYAPLANSVMFSPRFFVSRFESNASGLRAIADVARGTATRQALDPISKQIANDYVKFLGSTTAVLGLAALAGADVETDPRSSDAGKIKVGNTRYDLWAGNQPIVRYATQFAKGQRKDERGNITDYGRGKVALNFIRSKLAPATGLIWDMMAGGRTPAGLDLTDTSPENVRKVLMDEFAPMILNDVIEAMQNNEYGVAGAALGLPAAVGIGVNTFEPEPSGGTMRGRPTRRRAPRPTRSTR